MTEQEEIERLRNIEREELGKISMGPWGISFDGRHKEIEMAISSLEEIQQYRALGTVKELREAMEKQREKKPKTIEQDYSYYVCPACGEAIYSTDSLEEHHYCLNCGQAIDWSVEE